MSLGVFYTVRINDGEDMRSPRVDFAPDELILFRKKVNHVRAVDWEMTASSIGRQCVYPPLETMPMHEQGQRQCRHRAPRRVSGSIVGVWGRRANRECPARVIYNSTADRVLNDRTASIAEMVVIRRQAVRDWKKAAFIQFSKRRRQSRFILC
jgi:hypothetical protein